MQRFLLIPFTSNHSRTFSPANSFKSLLSSSFTVSLLMMCNFRRNKIFSKITFIVSKSEFLFRDDCSMTPTQQVSFANLFEAVVDLFRFPPVALSFGVASQKSFFTKISLKFALCNGESKGEGEK
jgi:hypothetical protein